MRKRPQYSRVRVCSMLAKERVSPTLSLVSGARARERSLPLPLDGRLRGISPRPSLGASRPRLCRASVSSDVAAIQECHFAAQLDDHVAPAVVCSGIPELR